MSIPGFFQLPNTIDVYVNCCLFVLLQQYWADKKHTWRYVPVADLAAAFQKSEVTSPDNVDGGKTRLDCQQRRLVIAAASG